MPNPGNCCECCKCCKGWNAPTTLILSISCPGCPGLDGKEVTLTGDGGASRYWSGTLQTDCGDIDIAFNCWPEGSYDEETWPCGVLYLMGGWVPGCYTGLIQLGFTETPNYPDPCNPFHWTGFDYMTGPDCNYQPCWFTITE